MNRLAMLFVCAFLFVGIVPSVDGQSMKKMLEQQGSTFPLYFEAKPNRSVLVGTVESVENSTLILGGSTQQARPKFVLNVDEVLAGHAGKTEILHGQNTFVFTEAGWSPKIVTGAPWIVVGNRVLVVVDDYNVQEESGAALTIRQIRNAWFLMEEKGGNSRVLYEQSLSTVTGYEDIAFNKSALSEIFASIVQDFSPTEFRVQDVVESIMYSKEDTK